MHILFLNLYGQRIKRGAESFSHDLATRLSINHQVTFNKGDSDLMPASSFKGSFTDRLQKRLFLDRPGRQVLAFSLRQISHILTRNYHIVIPLNGFWQLLILKLLKPVKGYKIIVTGHSGPGWDERWNLWLKPDAFVATTTPTLTWAKRIAPWTKSVLIPYGVDSTLFKVKPAKLPLKLPIILCPSALVPYKRIDLAIRAVARLGNVSLLILGQGPLKNQLASLGQQLLGHRFMIKSAPYSQMPSYYSACSAVTLPSDPQENSPMIFLEALAAGKPVVATDSPRARWALRHAGYYTHPQNLDHYAQMLSKALKSTPDTKKPLGKFLWPKVLNKYQQLFKSLLNGN